MLRSTSLAIALGAVLAVPAFAGEQLASGTQPVQVAAAGQANASAKTQMSVVAAYDANVNPLAFVLEKVGPYDIEDAFRGPNGFPLPGWADIANPASGGGNGGGE
jgi:hypothetical protein